VLVTNIYDVEVEPGTRNHKGSFVRDTTYKLIGIDQAGWAFICQDNTTCHYVDPDCLRGRANLSDGE
jgi:hypothetical protein